MDVEAIEPGAVFAPTSTVEIQDLARQQAEVSR
jgi:hypothetical protein